MVVQPGVASESHAHRYGFCRLEAREGHVKHKIQHDIRTGSVQSCQEAQTKQRTCRIHQHFHAVLSPI